MKIKVAVHGSYFVNNFGDTLLVRLMCDKLASMFGKDSVYLAIKGNAQEQAHIGYPVAPKSIRDHIDLLIFAGGGYFGEPDGSWLHKTRWSIRNTLRHLMWLSQYRGAKYAFIGVGCGPLSVGWFKQIVQRAFRKSEGVLLRDNESINYFSQYGFNAKTVSGCVDLALSLSKAPAHLRTTRVGLHITKLSQDEIFSVIQSLLEQDVVSSLDDIDILSDQGTSFSETIIRTFRQVCVELRLPGSPTFLPYDGVDLMLDRLSRYRLVVTDKLHVGIVTISLGGKVISIPSHSKTQRLYRQLGLDAFCLPRNEFDKHKMTAALKSLGEFRPDQEVVEKGLCAIDNFLDNLLLCVQNKVR